MGRRMIALVSALAALLLTTAPAALAVRPVHEVEPQSGTVVVHDICDFPVTVEYMQVGNGVFRFDGQGNLIGAEAEIREQDTFTAVHTLVSEPYTFHVSLKLDAGGDPVMPTYSGILLKVRLPDGSMFIAAGSLPFPEAEFVILSPAHGHSPDIDAFCAALGV